MCSCIENMCNRLNRLVFIPPPTSLAASRPRPGPPEAEYFLHLALCCQILNVVQSLSGPFVPVSDSFQWHYVTLNVRSLVFLPPPKKPGGINVCQIVNVFRAVLRSKLRLKEREVHLSFQYQTVFNDTTLTKIYIPQRRPREAESFGLAFCGLHLWFMEREYACHDVNRCCTLYIGITSPDNCGSAS